MFSYFYPMGVKQCQKQPIFLGMITIPPTKNGDDWGIVYDSQFYPHYDGYIPIKWPFHGETDDKH